MDITIREFDENNFEHVNQIDDTFIVNAKLRLHAENEKIVYTAVEVSSYEKRYPVETVDYTHYIRRPDKIIFLAYIDSQIVGRIILRKNWNQYGYIEDLAVDTRHRKLGVGRRLITIAVAWAKAAQLPGLMLETQNTNVAACRLYERCGFRLGGFDNYLYRGINRGPDEVALYWYLFFDEDRRA